MNNRDSLKRCVRFVIFSPERDRKVPEGKGIAVQSGSPVKKIKITRSDRVAHVFPYHGTLAPIYRQGRFVFKYDSIVTVASSPFPGSMEHRSQSIHCFIRIKRSYLTLFALCLLLFLPSFVLLVKLRIGTKKLRWKNVNEWKAIKPEDRGITRYRRVHESTERVQDYVVLVAEINWRRLGDRRTAGLGLAAVRHHWLTQPLLSLFHSILYAIPLALPTLCLFLSLFLSCFLSILPPSLVHTPWIRDCPFPSYATG